MKCKHHFENLVFSKKHGPFLICSHAFLIHSNTTQVMSSYYAAKIDDILISDKTTLIKNFLFLLISTVSLFLIYSRQLFAAYTKLKSESFNGFTVCNVVRFVRVLAT